VDDAASGTNALSLTTVAGSIVYEMARGGEDTAGANTCNGTISDASLTTRTQTCSTGGAPNVAARLRVLDTNLPVTAGSNSYTITWGSWATVHIEHVVVEIK